jgi:hypothetical protein
MLSDTLRMVAAELKLHEATGLFMEAEAVSTLKSLLERMAVEMAAIEAMPLETPQLTQEHLQGGKVVQFPVTRRPTPGGAT